MTFRLRNLVILLLFLNPGSGRSQTLSPAPFQAGDTWCVLGDSITEGGHYHQYMELFFITRDPGSKMDVINCGVRGDTAAHAHQRLKWDCLDRKPTVVSVMLGMNDVGRSSYKYPESPDFANKALARAETYERELHMLAKLLADSGVRTILIKPSIFDETADLPTTNLPGCGEALAGYGNIVEKIAGQLHLPVVDFNTPMKAINQKLQQSDPHFSIVGPDRVHPTAPGHFVMAYEFLKAMNAPGIVSQIGIDAASESIVRTDNCQVTELKIEPDAISFQCLENALPLPVEKSASPALDFVPFTRELNQQILQVGGLKHGDYELLIDGKIIRTFSSAQLAEGVNLAEEKATPQYQQAEKVLAALGQKWNAAAKLRAMAFIEHTIWPSDERPVDPKKIPEELDSGLDKLTGGNPTWKERLKNNYLAHKTSTLALHDAIGESTKQARQAAAPLPHRFQLRSISL